MINAKKYRKKIDWERLDLFRKIRDNKGGFHAMMGTVKDRNSKDLTDAEEVSR